MVVRGCSIEARGEPPPVPARLPLWTAMKVGLRGGTLGVSSRSEHEEARWHVARWIGFESPAA